MIFFKKKNIGLHQLDLAPSSLYIIQVNRVRSGLSYSQPVPTSGCCRRHSPASLPLSSSSSSISASLSLSLSLSCTLFYWVYRNWAGGGSAVGLNKDGPPACRVDTVCDESRYLTVRNVPALGCGDEWMKLLAQYGEIEECKPMDAEIVNRTPRHGKELQPQHSLPSVSGAPSQANWLNDTIRAAEKMLFVPLTESPQPWNTSRRLL